MNIPRRRQVSGERLYSEGDEKLLIEILGSTEGNRPSCLGGKLSEFVDMHEHVDDDPRLLACYFRDQGIYSFDGEVVLQAEALLAARKQGWEFSAATIAQAGGEDYRDFMAPAIVKDSENSTRRMEQAAGAVWGAIAEIAAYVPLNVLGRGDERAYLVERIAGQRLRVGVTSMDEKLMLVRSEGRIFDVTAEALLYQDVGTAKFYVKQMEQFLS